LSGGTVTLRFEAAGSSLKLIYAGTLSCYPVDSSFATGFTGMRASTALTTAIDSFQADAIALTNPVLPFPDDFRAPVNGNQLSRNWTERLGNFTVNAGQQLVGNAALDIATLNGVPPLADESVQV